jgi:hypothetical protein
MAEERKIKLYTSYYAKTKALEKAGIVPIGISLQIPKWFNGIGLIDLAPGWDMMKMSKDVYSVHYKLKLESIDLRMAFKHIKAVAKGNDVALVCYESLKTDRENDWCHRTMFAEWMEEKHGMIITEWVDPNDVEKEKKIKNKAALKNSQYGLKL